MIYCFKTFNIIEKNRMKMSEELLRGNDFIYSVSCHLSRSVKSIANLT